MKINILQEELSKCVNIVQKGISNRTTLPILSGILLEACNNNIKLTGTDLEIGIKTSAECEVTNEGMIVIPSKIFGDIVRKLPNLPVTIESNENNIINISCGNSKFSLAGQPALEYPELPQIDNEVYFNIPKDLLKTMIRQTIFATAQDETRPILTGCLLEVNNNKAALVALDGYRLTLKNINVDCSNDIKVVIPGKTLSDLYKILDDGDSLVTVAFAKSHVIFDLDNSVIISRLLEGQFLNYKDIIRNEYKSKVKVKTKDIQESIERASLLVREGKNNLVKLDITDENMIITSNSEIGNVHEEIPIELEGNDIKIAFNSKYILDGIRAIDSEEIIMHFISNVNPCIINPYEDNTYTYLILPVRLAVED